MTKLVNSSLLAPLRMWKRKHLLTSEDKKHHGERVRFYGSFVAPGDLVYDVGANMGNRVAPLLEVGARVVAVEPQAFCYKFLRYRFGDKITLVTKGLSDKESVEQMFIADANVISSFSKEWIDKVKADRFKGNNWNKSVEVPMTTLDKLIEQYGRPAFIKIDVEGYELQVLRGLSQPIPLISLEYTVPEQLTMAADCIDRVVQNGGALECNYSVGESMELALQQWQAPEDFKATLQTPAFISTGFGDIYIRLKN